MADILKNKIEAFIRDCSEFSRIKDDPEAQRITAECLNNAIIYESGYLNGNININLHLDRDMLLEWLNQEEKIPLREFLYVEYMSTYDDDLEIISNIESTFTYFLEEKGLCHLSADIKKSEWFRGELNEAELFTFTYNWELVDSPLRVNLILAVGDEANSDFSNGFVLERMVSGTMEPGADSVHDCALAWLIRQQGYSFRDLVTRSTPFLDSVRQEMLDSTSSMNALTVCLRIDEKELEEMLDSSHAIRIDKGATIGLYNPWNGSGGMLDINLEKDLIISRSMIHDIQIESERHDRTKNNNGYTVDETYGFTRRCWQRWYSPATAPVHVVTPEQKTEDIEFLKEYCREQEEIYDVSP